MQKKPTHEKNLLSSTSIISPNKKVNSHHFNKPHDLKHFLTYSDTKISPVQDHCNTIQLNSSYMIINNNPSNNVSFNCHFNQQNEVNPRVNSETSLSHHLTNKHVIYDAMKFLRFQTSSLDHQRYTYEKLLKSKARYFCLLIGNDSSNKHYVKK
jgi:hypothetical protein